MRDCLLVALVLSTSTAIGYPACLLFPPQQFKARLVAARVVGFSVLAAATIVLYPLGVPPTVSVATLTAAGLCACFLDVLRRRPKISSLQPGSSWPAFYDSLFSLPAEAVIAGMGLYYFLPTAAWPLSLAVAWKLFLCLAIAIALAAVARAVMESWRQNRASGRSRMIAGVSPAAWSPS
jgi:hypothetical protein